ncbi:unnamed protein product [Blepharisma stoltei]|uniref:Uncharacterized protein n=1 Tax=Blepharisma stoltei TaxID=1481888 RepID=A0AAU9KAF9_9CILI|nr:unnamed protein product [Blepharisma stoltei]
MNVTLFEDCLIYELERQQLRAELGRVDRSMLNFRITDIVLYSYDFQKLLSRLGSFHPLIVKKNNKSIEVKEKNSSLLNETFKIYFEKLME